MACLYHGSKLGPGAEGGRFFLERKLRIRHITTRGRSRQPPPSSDLDEGLSLWPYHPRPGRRATGPRLYLSLSMRLFPSSALDEAARGGNDLAIELVASL